jgi:hypothetical protein
MTGSKVLLENREPRRISCSSFSEKDERSNLVFVALYAALTLGCYRYNTWNQHFGGRLGLSVSSYELGRMDTAHIPCTPAIKSDW